MAAKKEPTTSLNEQGNAAPTGMTSNGPPSAIKESTSGANTPTLAVSQQSSRTVSPNRQPSKASDSQNAKPNPPPNSARSSRLASNVTSAPSAAAVATALSSLNFTNRHSTVADPSKKDARSPRQASLQTDGTALHWPISPRLKSPPPPSGSRRGSLVSRQSDSDMEEPRKMSKTLANSDSASSRTIQEHLLHSENGRSLSSSQNISVPKTPRGPSGLSSKLETVEEGEHSTSPEVTNGSLSGADVSDEKATESDPQIAAAEQTDNTSGVNESGKDVAGIKGAESSKEDGKANDTALAPSKKRSFSALAPTKTRAATDGSSNLISVETETVSSIPQAAATASASERGVGARGDGSGLLRSKTSSEMMKPKREKKRSRGKLQSLMSSGASSKADIFEANVASAVDEADSEDSEETFVYESNPAEHRSRISGRHHSRTPSATSMTSLLDRKGGVRGKRSMKFASNSYAANNADNETGDRNSGTVRTHQRPQNLSELPSHSSFIGRGLHLSEESPFSHASKVRSSGGFGSRHSSRPVTPKNSHYLRTPVRKGDLSPSDFEGQGTEDELTPLVGTVRTRRSRRFDGRELPPYAYYEPRRSWVARFAGCVVMAVTLCLVVLGAAGFLFATTKPLSAVSVREIQNVLASEQEIMLDLLVQATNPNLMAVTIADMDVNVFAKSKHVGTSQHLPYRLSPSPHVRRRSQQLHPRENRDDGTDPMPSDPDESDERQTMLLGRILHFDSALTFEGSPFQRAAQTSSGEVRLAKPGNHTEAGGSKRWENVLKYEFELIVRGILKYQLPLSSRTMTAPISSKVVVCPEDDGGTPKILNIEDDDNGGGDHCLKKIR